MPFLRTFARPLATLLLGGLILLGAQQAWAYHLYRKRAVEAYLWLTAPVARRPDGRPVTRADVLDALVQAALKAEQAAGAR